MKKPTILLALVLLSVATQAQKAQLFKHQILPNHTYTLISKQGFDIDMTPIDSVSLAKTSKPGAMKSVQLRSMMESGASVKTAQATASKNIPLTMTCNSIATKANVNGQEYPVPPNNPAVGQTVNGQVDAAGNITVDTTTAADAVKAAARSAIGDIPKQIKFPDKKLKIGDTFTQEESIYDLNLPMGFDNTQEYMMKVVYTLTGIKDKLAYFDTKMELNMDYSKEAKGKHVTFKGTGTGSGKMVFNIVNEYPQSVNRDLNMAINVDAGKDMKMDIKVRLSRDEQYMVAAN